MSAKPISRAVRRAMQLSDRYKARGVCMKNPDACYESNKAWAAEVRKGLGLPWSVAKPGFTIDTEIPRAKKPRRTLHICLNDKYYDARFVGHAATRLRLAHLERKRRRARSGK